MNAPRVAPVLVMTCMLATGSGCDNSLESPLQVGEDAPATIVGTVHAERPIGDAPVAVRSAAGVTSSTIADATGGFVFAGLSASHYSIAATPSAHFCPAVTVRVRAGDTARVDIPCFETAGFAPRIAFVRFGAENVIHVANADGSHVRPVTAGSWPSWSPDGRTIAFTRATERLVNGQATTTSAIWTINVDGTNPRWLAWGDKANWSPDGARILFIVSHDALSGAGELFAVNVDGSGTARIQPDAAADSNCAMDVIQASWSPDGQTIAIATGDADDGGDVCVMRTDGSDARPLNADGSLKFGRPLWAPDGSRIAINAWDYVGGQRTRVVSIYSPDGPKLSSVDLASPRMTAHDWSADGRELIFSHGYSVGGCCTQVSRIEALSLETGNARDLLPYGVVETQIYSDWYAVWSPAGG